MNENQFKFFIIKRIFLLSSLLYGFIILMGIMGVFIEDQAWSLLKIITVGNAIYLAACFKFIISKKYSDEVENDKFLDKKYQNTTSKVIYINYIILFLVVAICAFDNSIITYKNLTQNIIPLFETIFGIYVGWFIDDLFTKHEK